MSFRRRIFWLILFVALYCGWVVTPALAHALLVRSNPAANAVLTQPPVQVEIYFSEPLESQLSSIRVIDSNGVSVDAGDVRVDPSDPTRLTVTLHSLSDGVYTVTWKVVSSIDGHQTTGSFPFAVGDANAQAVSAIQQKSTFRLPFSTLLSKFLMLASLALLLGSRLFTLLVWDPAVKSEAGHSSAAIPQPPIWKRLYRIGLISILISIGLGILAQAGQSTGGELAAPWNPELGRILTETRLGVIWLARLALAALAVWLAGSGRSRLAGWSSFVVNLALLFTVSLTSHAATEPRPLLPLLADWIHLLGMTFWLGGLVYFFTAIRQFQLSEGQLRTRYTSALAARFSANALIVVGLIGLTGFYSAYLRVGSWSALLTSLYGHVLLVKQGFVGGLLVVAAINLLVISPRLKRERFQGVANTDLVSRFGKILIIELSLAGLLLASVSFLTYIPPAKIAAASSGLTDRTQADDLKLDLSISPGRVGANTFTLHLSSAGEPLRSAREVLLRFTPGQADIPPSELELISQGDGTFQAKGAFLSLPGDWQVQAVVRREDKFDTFADFNFKLQKPGAANEVTAAAVIQAGWLMAVIGLLSGFLTFAVDPKPALRYGAGMPLTVLMIGVGVFSLLRPAPANLDRENPIPMSSESVTSGQTLFSVNCAPCHGQTGKGDGPVGITLNPRPADLTQHAIPGIHTDAQLFEWITNGFPGSRMPAFKSALSDTDRWNLVNFIRSLAPR